MDNNKKQIDSNTKSRAFKATSIEIKTRADCVDCIYLVKNESAKSSVPTIKLLYFLI